MQPDVVFGVLDMLGAQAGRILVVGCEPASVEDGIGLSEPVAAAVDAAVRVVTRLAAEATGGAPPTGRGHAGDAPAQPPASDPGTFPAGPAAPDAGARALTNEINEGMVVCASAYRVR